jgi:hypothetical protein
MRPIDGSSIRRSIDHMPEWLFAKGFNPAGISVKEVTISGKMAIKPTIP